MQRGLVGGQPTRPGALALSLCARCPGPPSNPTQPNPTHTPCGLACVCVRLCVRLQAAQHVQLITSAISLERHQESVRPCSAPRPCAFLAPLRPAPFLCPAPLHPVPLHPAPAFLAPCARAPCAPAPCVALPLLQGRPVLLSLLPVHPLLVLVLPLLQLL